MGKSPTPIQKDRQTTQQTRRPISAPMLLIMTALDTTWRAFLPTIGGTILGIGLDHLWSIAPIMTIVCIVLGAILSAVLIAKQLLDVRKIK